MWQPPKPNPKFWSIPVAQTNAKLILPPVDDAAISCACCVVSVNELYLAKPLVTPGG